MCWRLNLSWFDNFGGEGGRDIARESTEVGDVRDSIADCGIVAVERSVDGELIEVCAETVALRVAVCKKTKLENYQCIISKR